MLKGISTTKLAEICGVSQGTVDRALNNRKGISEATKEKILQVAKEYGYRPNYHARAMRSGKSNLIGIVVFDLDNQYFADIVTNIEDCCSRKGYSTVVMFTNKQTRREIECVENLVNMAVDGIVICPINQGEDFENYLLNLKIPVVTVGNRLKNIPYIGINNTLAMKETVDYVISKGYDRLIYVKPHMLKNNTFAQNERLSAFSRACTNTEHVITDTYGALNEIKPDKKNVLICPTDIYAVKLFVGAKNLDAGVIGFDNIRLLDELGIKLDSVGYDIFETARVITNFLVDGRPFNGYIAHKIIERGSL